MARVKPKVELFRALGGGILLTMVRMLRGAGEDRNDAST